jgi:ketosteroid isomerase-like protein
MATDAKDSPEALEERIGRYNDAWNDHDLDAIMAMHAPDMVFENHTAGEAAAGEEARGHIGSIFETSTPTASRSCGRWACWLRRVDLVTS